MQEPCRSCDRRVIDFGGCRCQAFAVAGDAAATDPACRKSPNHERFASYALTQLRTAPPPLEYRRARGAIEV